MGKGVIHYYPSQTAYLSAACGIYYSDIEEHTSEIKYVTCKKCLKKINSALLNKKNKLKV